MILLICAAVPATAAKVGPEFVVSTKALNSAIAPLSSGGFVVVWRGDDPRFPIIGQRYTKAGAKLGASFVVVGNAPEKVKPAVAGLQNGGFVVAWDAPDANGLGSWVQAYNVNAVKVGAKVRANSVTVGDQFGPSVVGLKNGTFVVMWTSNGQAGSSSGVFGQRFTAAGVKQGAEFRAYTTVLNGTHQFPCISALSGGGFVAVWRSSTGTSGQRFDPTGGKVGNEFQVNTANEGLLQHPVVAGLSTGGGFVVAREVQGATLDILAQRYNANGVKVGGSFRVHPSAGENQFDPAITGLTNGGFVVVWSHSFSNHLAHGRLYNANGVAVGGTFRLNSSVVPIDASPAVGPLRGGAFIATWQGSAPNAVFVVRGQRFDGR